MKWIITPYELAIVNPSEAYDWRQKGDLIGTKILHQNTSILSKFSNPNLILTGLGKILKECMHNLHLIPADFPKLTAVKKKKERFLTISPSPPNLSYNFYNLTDTKTAKYSTSIWLETG